MKKFNWIGITLLVLLFVMSMFKDNFTPDYRNTPAALFLSPEYLSTSRVLTLTSHFLFWLKAMLYTVCFIVLPSTIIHTIFKQRALSLFTCLLHLVIAIVLYTAIFINEPAIDSIFVSKINRYLHSPIITLFLWAAFQLNKSTIRHRD